MSRRRKAVIREIRPDARYNDKLVAKFINFIMKGGKKSIAEKIVYDVLDRLKQNTKDGKTELEQFVGAIGSVEPKIEVKSRRVGGATYQVPIDVPVRRAKILAIRWVIQAVRKRKEKTTADRLYSEIMDIQNNRGAALKTRENTHKMAEANRAFAHYKW